MAYENKYQQYLNDNRDTSPNIVQTISNASAKAVGAAALLGGGYIGFRALKSSGFVEKALGDKTVVSGINKLRQKFDFADAYMQGINKTIKSSGYMRILTGEANDEMKANFMETLTRAKMGQIRPLSGDPTKFEKFLYDVTDARREFAKRTMENVRLENIIGDIKSSTKSPQVSGFLEKVLRAERDNKQFLDGKGSRDQDFINEILKKHDARSVLSGVQYMEAQKKLGDILPNHQLYKWDNAARTYKVNQDYVKVNKGAIQKQFGAIEQQYKDAIVRDLKRKSFVDKAMAKVPKNAKIPTGYEKLTVGKAVELQVFNTPVSFRKRPVVRPSADGEILDMLDINPQTVAESLKKDKDFWEQISSAYVDPMVFVNKKNTVLDMRFPGRAASKAIQTLADNTQVPFVNIRPFRILGGALGLGRNQMPIRTTFASRAIMPTINNSLQELGEDHFYFAGTLVNSKGEMLRKNTYLASSKFGPWQRALTAMSGHTMNPKIDIEPKNTWDYIKKNIISLGYQDFESSIKRKSTLVTKFFDPDWEPNIWKEMTREGSDYSGNALAVQRAYRKFFSTVDSNVAALDRDTIKSLAPYLDGVLSKEAINKLVNGTQQDGTMNAIFELLQKDNKLMKSITDMDTTLAYKSQLETLFRQFKADPSSFDKPFRTFKHGHSIVAPDAFEALSANTTDLLTKIDEAEKILHAELLNQIEVQKGSGFTVSKMVEEMLKNGATDANVTGIRKLNVHKQLQRLGGPDYYQGQGLPDDKLREFASFIQGKNISPVRDELKEIIHKANPNLGYGNGQSYDSIFKNTDYLLMNEAHGVHPLKAMNEALAQGKSMQDAMRAAYGQVADIGHQLGLGGKGRYGRNHLDKVTTLTNLSYYYGFRLNEGLSKIGLGLSYKDMGSAQDIAKNMFLKRIMVPMVGIGAFNYMNDELGNVFGEKPTETFSRGYANMTVGVQTVKEITGLNAFGEYMERLLPGSDRLKENPFGLALKFGTFGILGETRSGEEMRDYYTNGMDPVRKGRFWSIGSSTPIYGDRIMYYQPNWYRRLQSDYMMTDVMYGSTGEYWANNWMPNPRNPLGFLNPLTWQHWERKHYKDRPYPVSQTSLNEIPLVGPILDSTIGRIAHPLRRRAGLQKAHEEYLADINKIIEGYAQQGVETEGGTGSYMYMTPGGRMTPSTLQSDTGGAPVLTESGEIQVVGAGGGFSPMQSGSYINRSDVTARNRAMVSKAHVKAMRSTSIQSLRDNIVVDNLSDAMDPNSGAYRLSESYYSLTEIGGIYGFLTTSMLGDFEPSTILQSSMRMKGLERMFWDLELGGTGGEISEIYRRFLPHRRKGITEYNPFKNQMPSWMPGPEYFTDFRHGDPYVKIPKGEMRLPGAGYESLNRLHPDFFGRYGALDRFKILADVAPYSDQYKYYSSVVSRMNEAGMISDQDFEDVKKVRDMVSQKKEKYDLHPYKYKYADIKKQDVTILRWIDKDTFVTKEFEGNPIRLAGISMPGEADESDQAKEARAYLQEQLAPGTRVTIGIDADPVNRVRDDTMGTMHAVVYDKAGDSIGAKMTRKFDKAVKADYEDLSATAVNALYDKPEITVGKMWESFAHLDTPFHTKILQIRSPLEMYKRKELYGKSWQTWSHPVRDWLAPTFESFWSHNPIVSTGLGAGIGWLVGIFGRSKKPTTVIGALIGGLGSSARTVGELTQRNILQDRDYAWIPQRRQKEREIEEYFDMIKYVKYRGLYEKARQIAIQEEGVDPEDFERESRRRSRSTSYVKHRLESAKKWLRINTGHPFADKEENMNRLAAIGDALDDIDANRVLVGSGIYTMRALQYKEEYKSTLYGADPNGDLMSIYRALPKKDKPFFKYFMLASPKEREEILRLVPKNQRRFYQAKWGLPVDSKPSLVEYFAKKKLPGADWAGWKPQYSVDELKLKFVKNEGLEIGEFGYWEDDLKGLAGVPDVGNIRNFNFLDSANLLKVLEGRGITDADIKIEVERNLPERPNNPMEFAVNIVHDRRKDITNAINSNIAFLLGGE